MTESTLAADIKGLIEKDPRINQILANVIVRTEDERVVLSGQVGSIRDKRIIAEIARSTGGVHGVHDHIRVQQDEVLPDDELRKKIIRAFVEDKVLQESRLDALVADGDVELIGSVNALVDKKLAEATIWWLRGVRYIENNIVVDPPEPESDAILHEGVRAILDKDSLVDDSGIFSSVLAGVVNLWGAVASNEQRSVAESDCWCVPGVRDVVNDLKVVEI